MLKKLSLVLVLSLACVAQTTHKAGILDLSQTWTGTNTFKNVNGIRYADQFSGADCSAKINAADADLGTSAGEIRVGRTCGSITANLTTTGPRLLRFYQGGTFTVSATTTPTDRLTIICSGSQTLNNGIAGSAATFKKAASLNGAMFVFPSASQGGGVQGCNFDAIAGSGGDGIQVTGNSIKLEDVSVINQAANGIRVGSDAAGANANSWHFTRVTTTNNGAAGIKIADASSNANAGVCDHCSSSSNTTDGVYIGSGSINGVFVDFHAESNTVAGIHMASGAEQQAFYGGDINEGNGTNLLIDSGANTAGPSYFHGIDTGSGVTDNGSLKSCIYNRNFSQCMSAATNFDLGASGGTSAFRVNRFSTGTGGFIVYQAGMSVENFKVDNNGNSAVTGQLTVGGNAIITSLGKGTFPANVVAPKFQATLSTPSASTDVCTAGQMWADASYVYVCTASNTIKRAALSTF